MTAENLPQRLVVEALGAFALCFIAIGSVVLTQGGDIVAIALATGLAIGVMVAAAGHISGGHYNPAITIGMLVTRRMPLRESIAYIVAQAVGSVLGAGAVTLSYLDIDRNSVDLGLPQVGTSLTADPAVSLSAGNALAMEAILTFFLVFVVFGTAVDRRSGGRWVASLAIGITIVIGNLAGAAVSGAAMNPIRWFGPAVIQQEFDDFWIWIVGPIAGGIVAALVYNEFLLGRWRVAADDVVLVEEIDLAEGESAPPTTRRRAKRKR